MGACFHGIRHLSSCSAVLLMMTSSRSYLRPCSFIVWFLWLFLFWPLSNPHPSMILLRRVSRNPVSGWIERVGPVKAGGFTKSEAASITARVALLPPHVTAGKSSSLADEEASPGFAPANHCELTVPVMSFAPQSCQSAPHRRMLTRCAVEHLRQFLSWSPAFIPPPPHPGVCPFLLSPSCISKE